MFGNVLVAFAMVALLMSSLTTSVFAANDTIKLTSSSDNNGAIYELVLKGDANVDGVVNISDLNVLRDIVAKQVNYPGENTAIFKNCNINENDVINAYDVDLLRQLVDTGATTTLPDDSFTFSVVDKPNGGYRVVSATITADNNADVVLTPDNPISGDYKLTIATDGKATVTGKSLATNVIKFAHELDPAVITLSFGTDGNGAINEWTLKGDENADQLVSALDLDVARGIVAGEVTYPAENTGLFKSCDINGNNAINTADIAILRQLVDIGATITLPNASYTFSIVDKPNSGYSIVSATIKADNNADVVLTPDNPTSGDYTLTIAADGTATVTGQSLAVNDVKFAHKLTTVPNTGVSSNIWLYSGLLAGALVFMGYVIYSKKRKARNI